MNDPDLLLAPSARRADGHPAPRLAELEGLTTAPCLRALALSGGERVLEVGAGLGVLARAAARSAPDVRVVAVEADPIARATAARLAAAAGERQLVDLRAGAADALPLRPAEWGTFDVAFGRFVVERSPAPARVVAELARAVRPGGRVVLVDDDHALLSVHPAVDGLDAVWAAYGRSLGRRGLDPWVGRRLPGLLHDAGLLLRGCDWIFSGGCSGDARFAALAERLVELLAGARDGVLATAEIDAAGFDATLERLRAWRWTPGAALWHGACVAAARRPCGNGFTLTP